MHQVAFVIVGYDSGKGADGPTDLEACRSSAQNLGRGRDRRLGWPRGRFPYIKEPGAMNAILLSAEVGKLLHVGRAS